MSMQEFSRQFTEDVALERHDFDSNGQQSYALQGYATATLFQKFPGESSLLTSLGMIGCEVCSGLVCVNYVDSAKELYNLPTNNAYYAFEEGVIAAVKESRNVEEAIAA